MNSEYKTSTEYWSVIQGILKTSLYELAFPLWVTKVSAPATLAPNPLYLIPFYSGKASFSLHQEGSENLTEALETAWRQNPEKNALS